MTSESEASTLPAEDYQAIEDAVMETARGRWFLAEYARRHRAADTDTIVSSLERLEKLIKRDRQAPDIDRIRLDLADMAEAISRTKQEIAQLKIEADRGGRFAEASSELDAIVNQTEGATNEILRNAERVQELAWTFREAGADPELCDQLEASASEIYTACSFQDLTGQRTRKVVTVLRYLESRINAMIGIWGLGEAIEDATVVGAPANPFDTRPDAHLLNGPPLAGHGIDQTAVDDLMDAAAVPPEEPTEVHRPDDEAEPDARFEASPADAGETARQPFDIDAGGVFVIEDDLILVAPAGEPEAQGAAAAEPDIFAKPGAVSSPDKAEADLFATAFAIHTEAVIGTGADVFAPPAGPEPALRRASAAPARRTGPATIGNTALAVSPEPDASAAADTAPALAIVPDDDPIAALDTKERLIVFG